MKKTLILLSILTSFVASAQSIEISPNGGTTNSSAILDLKSTTKGFLLPRMTNAQMRAILNPAQGLLAFCNDCSTNGDYYFYKGTEWVALGSTTVSVSATVGPVGANASENGATITNGVLNLAPADASNPGIVTTGAQTIAGVKTFSNGIVGNVTGNATTVTTNANLTGIVTSVGNATSIANGAITNAMLANGAVANLSGTNTGDQTLPTLSSLGAVASNSAITGATNTKITYDAKGLVTAGAAATTADIEASTNKNYVTDAQLTKINNTSGTNTGDQTLPTLSSLGAVASNTAITGATNTKITYDAKGLVTAGTAATTADIAESTDKKYITDAQLTKINNTLGTNTGDNAVNSLYSGLVTNATHTGDVTGSTALTITNDAVTTAKIAAGAITDSKVTDVAASKITGTLPVSKGGTGSDTQNFVDLTTAQTIAGAKTFTADLTVNGITVGKGTGGISTNTAVGASALSSNTTGFGNTANGKDALFSNTTGINNTANGVEALYHNTTGTENTANGANALFSNTTGFHNTANGSNALLSNTEGTRNTANGVFALLSNINGSHNTAIGWNVLTENSSGSNNTATGSGALFSNTTGEANTANGMNALSLNLSGSNNTAFGQEALYANTLGNDNTAFGNFALKTNTTGTYNTAIGTSAGVLTGNLSNTTAIGYGATVNANNKIQLGNAAVTDVQFGTGSKVTLETGFVKITGGTPGAGKVLTSDADGLASWTTPSSDGVDLTTAQTIAGVKTFSVAPVLSTATASKALFTDVNKNIVSNAITGTGNVVMSDSPTLVTPNLGTPSAAILTNATGLPLTKGVTEILPVLNGGTGSSTKNFVDLTNAQTIEGAKTFRDGITANVNGHLSGTALTATTATNISGGAAGSIPYQTATGTTSLLAAGSSGQVLTSTGLGTLTWATASSSGVDLTTDQTIGGVKTFSALPILSSATASKALFTDANKNIVSKEVTGSGNVVMSTSPAFTGTITAASQNLSGTLGVGTSSPVASAKLDITSTTQGFLPPRMTQSQRDLISPKVAGLMIYCTDCVTNGELQFYNGGSTWVSMSGGNSVPAAPTIGTASRGINQATVAFTPPANNGGSAITSYTVFTNPEGLNKSGTSSPITVTGLSTNTTYNFRVTATNTSGTSLFSGYSNSPYAPADAPTNVVATKGEDSKSTISFNTPPGNGSTITGYTITSNPEGIIATGTRSPIVVTGLTNGTYYTFTVKAINSYGPGVAGTSNSVMPYTLQSLCGPSSVTFTYNGTSVTYGVVVSANYECWLDRNLGATQVATSLTDAASYGDLFQAGRGADGHQLRTSGITSTRSTSDVPGNSNFIISANPLINDWRSTPNNNLWQGVNGVNNPCPSGFRLPTEAEMVNEYASWGINGVLGAFDSPLKLPLAGFRNAFDGDLYSNSTRGNYWASNMYEGYTGTSSLAIRSTFTGVELNSRNTGLSVRCIKD